MKNLEQSIAEDDSHSISDHQEQEQEQENQQDQNQPQENDRLMEESAQVNANVQEPTDGKLDSPEKPVSDHQSMEVDKPEAIQEKQPGDEKADTQQ